MLDALPKLKPMQIRITETKTHVMQQVWTEFEYSTGKGAPKSPGRYLVMRKDGKVHFENYNGSGWAYNGKSIIMWTKVNEPSRLNRFKQKLKPRS